MKKVAGRYRNSLNEFTAQLEDMITGLSKAHKRIDEKMKNEGDELNRVIDLYYDEVVKKLMEQKRQVKQEAHDMVLHNQKPMSAQLDQLKCAQAEVLSMGEIKDSLQESSDQMSARIQLTHDME